MKDLKTKERFIELRASGVSYQRISQELGVSKQTLIDWSRGVATEISNLRAIELEALYEKSKLAKEARLSVFGDMLQLLVNEVRKRDLSQVSESKLFELILRYQEALSSELKPIQFVETVQVSDFDFMGPRTENVTWTP